MANKNVVNTLLSGFIASTLSKKPALRAEGTPGAFGGGQEKSKPAGTKIARRAANKTIGVRVPTALHVIDGRVHVRDA